MGFAAPDCKYDCTLLFWAYLWSSCLDNANKYRLYHDHKDYVIYSMRPKAKWYKSWFVPQQQHSRGANLILCACNDGTTLEYKV